MVVAGVPGLRWDDVTATGTPTLWQLARDGAVGSLSVASASAVTCPVDGWLTLGAGNRARGPAPESGRCPAAPPAAAAGGAAGFAALEQDNRRLYFGTELGALAGAVRRSGGCVAAAGPHPTAVGDTGAALGAAGPDGRVDVALSDPADPASYRRCPVTIIGLPSVAGPDRPLAATRADAVLAAVDAARPAASELIVVGLAETDPRSARLHVAIATGARYPRGWLHSASTGRAPYVQLIDIAPTVLRDLGESRPAAMAGQPVESGQGRPGTVSATVASLVDLDRAATVSLAITPRFFFVLVALQFLLFPFAGIAVRRSGTAAGQDGRRLGTSARQAGRRATALRLVQLCGLAAAGVLASTFLANLVPWWRAAHPLAAVLVAVALADLASVALALLGPWRRHPFGPAGAVAGVTTVVLAVDLLTGGRLQLMSLGGYSPLIAGRFAGIGNVGFGIFATAALLLAAALAAGRSRHRALLLVAAVGAAAVVVDGAPPYGSDIGGVLSLLPAFTVLGMLLAGVRLRPVRLLCAGVAAVAVVAAFGLADYARPSADQTHLGRFVGQLLHGGASTVVRRKAAADLALLTHSVLTLLVPVCIVVLAGVLLRPPGWLRAAFAAAPTLRPGLLATFVMGVIGMVVNDSGIAIPALAMTVAIPLTIAVSAAAIRDRGVTVEFRGRVDRPAHSPH